MADGSSFGNRFKATTFGESHGGALGIVLDGCPAGVPFDLTFLRQALARRRPGGALVSGRNEPDEPEVLSGIYQNKTLGTPITIIIRNQDARSEDYAKIAQQARSGHADQTWKDKFGHVDPRGGGRSSGRETAGRVIAGAMAQMVLKEILPGVSVRGYALQIGGLELTQEERQKARSASLENIDSSPARFPSKSQKNQVEQLLSQAKAEGKSYGGIAELLLTGLPAGLGQPVFHKLKAELAYAWMGVGASSGVEFGAGFEASQTEGTVFHSRGKDHADYGGILGGISTGEPILARIAFKPTSSVLDVAKKGRHDPCIVPRAIPVLEAMAWWVIADQVLWSLQDRCEFIKDALAKSSCLRSLPSEDRGIF